VSGIRISANPTTGGGGIWSAARKRQRDRSQVFDRAERTFFFICEARALFPFFPPSTFSCVPLLTYGIYICVCVCVCVCAYPLNVYGIRFRPIEKRADPDSDYPFLRVRSPNFTPSLRGTCVIILCTYARTRKIHIYHYYYFQSLRGCSRRGFSVSSRLAATTPYQGSSPKGCACNSIRVGTHHVSHCDFHARQIDFAKNLSRSATKHLRFFSTRCSSTTRVDTYSVIYIRPRILKTVSYGFYFRLPLRVLL
jgi:hypothetical protein